MNLKSFLTPPQTIAIVGLSDKPERPSYGVASYLISHGFNVIPVNPTIATVLGLVSYPSLAAIPQDIRIDIVDIFRQSAEVMSIVKEILELKIKPLIWMQRVRLMIARQIDGAVSRIQIRVYHRCVSQVSQKQLCDRDQSPWFGRCCLGPWPSPPNMPKRNCLSAAEKGTPMCSALPLRPQPSDQHRCNRSTPSDRARSDAKLNSMHRTSPPKLSLIHI